MSREECKKGPEQAVTIAELMYCIYFAIMLFAKGIGLYEGQKLYTVCLLVSTLFLIIKLAMTKHSLLEYLIIGLLGAMGCVLFLHTREKSALIYIMMIIGMKNVSVKRVFKVGLGIWGGTFLFQVLTSLLGFRADTFFIHKKLGLGHLIRWSLGYPHPNVLHISYFILLAFILYCMQPKGKQLIKTLLFMFLGNLYVFSYSLSYTGFLLTTLFLMIYCYFQTRKEISRVEGILIQAVFPVCVLFSVVGPLIIQGKLFDIFNKILNTRFELSKYFLTTQKLGLFGTASFDVPDSSYNLDCSYVNVLFYHGIVLSLCMFVGYVLLIRYLYKGNRRSELAITLGIVIAGVSEPFLVNTSYKNLSFLFMGEMLFAMTERYNAKWTRLGKMFALLPVGEHLCVMQKEHSLSMWMRIKETVRRVCHQYKKCLIVAALVSFLATAVGYMTILEHPDSVYALLWNCDRKEDTGQALDAEYVYLDMEHLPENFHGRILNYKDKETPLYEFDGITVQYEYARKAVSYGIIIAGTITVFLTAGLSIGCAGRRKERQ